MTSATRLTDAGLDGVVEGCVVIGNCDLGDDSDLTDLRDLD